MAKKYSTHGIKLDYTYAVEQIADLLGVDIATVQRWIRLEGLRRVEGLYPHGVHSSELRRFIDAKNDQRKQPCKPHQIFCMKCQKPRQPKNGTAKQEVLTNGSIKIKARCSTCTAKMNRTIKAADWTENHPLALFLTGAKSDPNRADTQPRVCPPQMEMKL